MKFSIVTPSYNRGKYMNETIQSVLSQEGDFEIEYILQDGGSSEDVLTILKKWEERIASDRFERRCNNLTFRWVSEKDNGMYDAINNGFAKTSGDIMSWINTDDMYHPYAFQTISQIFSQYDDIHWITGIPNSYNEYGARSGMDTFPNAYSREFIKRGYYDVKYLKRGFNWIQQESTFWRSSLWEKAGGRLDTNKKYAADFYLWQEFSKHADLVKVFSFLGGYRSHDDQITGDQSKYREELDDNTVPPTGMLLLRIFLDNFPYCRKLIYNRHRGFPFLNLIGLRWEWVTGRTVEWSYPKKEWIVRLRGIVGRNT